MASSFSNPADNLAEEIHKIKFKNLNFFFEYRNVKENLIKYKCLSNKIDEKLKKRFKNTFKFSNINIDKFNLLLRKDIYPNKYMDEQKTLRKLLLPEKEDFYSSLNMEDIKGLDYNNFKKICKNFETKNLEEYHDLCLKSDTLLLADTFENF